MAYSDPEKKRTYDKLWHLERKEQRNRRRRELYQSNREHELAVNRRWEVAHMPERLAQKKRNRDTSPTYRKTMQRTKEARNERNKRWAKNNRDKMNSVKHRRRAIEAGCVGRHTTAQWIAQIHPYNRRCLRCWRSEPEIKLHRDHVVPVIVGGSNDIGNIQPLCETCNKWKGARTIDYRPTQPLRIQTRTIPVQQNLALQFSDTPR